MKRSGSDPTAAVVFDVFGTLLDVTASVEPARAALGADAERLGELWRRKQLELSWPGSLTGVDRGFDAPTADALHRATPAVRVAEPGLAEVLLEGWRHLPAFADAAATLDALRAGGLGVALPHHGTAATLQTALGSTGLRDRLDLVLSVEPAEIFEPAAVVYRLATTALELPAARIAFVSANSWDAHAAARNGCRSIRVDRSGLREEPLPGCPADQVGALGELSPVSLR
ncbi:MAG: haloacid dehalogenase type II [Geminicoccaceae bacterium]|nr:haloacid dehalogenase type II [Geminicoccaceae bacterium]